MADYDHRVLIEYEAANEGSRMKPFTIITNGDYGVVKRVSRLNLSGVIYEIYLIMDGIDPEELKRDLVNNGVFLLQMKIDGRVVFLHYKRDIISRYKQRSTTVIKSR